MIGEKGKRMARVWRMAMAQAENLSWTALISREILGEMLAMSLTTQLQTQRWRMLLFNICRALHIVRAFSILFVSLSNPNFVLGRKMVENTFNFWVLLIHSCTAITLQTDVRPNHIISRATLLPGFSFSRHLSILCMAGKDHAHNLIRAYSITVKIVRQEGDCAFLSRRCIKR